MSILHFVYDVVLAVNSRWQSGKARYKCVGVIITELIFIKLNSKTIESFMIEALLASSVVGGAI